MDSNTRQSKFKRTLLIADRSHDFHGAVDITDPSYDRDVWCRMNGVEVSPGSFVCIAERIEYDETYFVGRKSQRRQETYHEERVSRIAIIHHSLMPDPDAITAFPKPESFGLPVLKLGEIRVDTGLAGFFNEKSNCSEREKERISSVEHTGADVYVSRAGFFSSSGYGDWSYPVYGIGDPEDPGRYVALFLNFIDG